MNARVAGVMMDALWPERQVVVELGGRAAHASPARMERDRRRDLALRRAGYVVLRYTWRQLTAEPDLVAADLGRELVVDR